MTETTTHDGDPETDATAELTETQEAIVEATYSAVCEYGYADVTMQDIADRTDRSKAALHYHFDCRADLFREFLSYLHAEFVASTRDPPGATPAERLVALLQTILSTDGSRDDAESVRFTTAYLEMKAQAPYNEGLREGLQRIDEHLVSEVADLVTAGVEAGEFPPETEPTEVAAFVSTYLHGTWTRSVAAGSEIAAMRDRLVGYVTGLLTPETGIRTDLVEVAQ